MPNVSLAMLMGAVMEFCPDAIVSEQADGNIVIVTNMNLDYKGILSPFENEFDKAIDD